MQHFGQYCEIEWTSPDSDEDQRFPISHYEIYNQKYVANDYEGWELIGTQSIRSDNCFILDYGFESGDHLRFAVGSVNSIGLSSPARKAEDCLQIVKSK